jgi:hypothetical protein
MTWICTEYSVQCTWKRSEKEEEEKKDGEIDKRGKKDGSCSYVWSADHGLTDWLAGWLAGWLTFPPRGTRSLN